MSKIIRAGRGLYAECPYCGSLVRLNKPLLGALHVCLTDEEIAEIDRVRVKMSIPDMLAEPGGLAS